MEFADIRQLRKYEKAFPREFDSCFRNLDRVLPLLESPGLGAFALSFFRNEFGSVWRIGQTGVPHARETRLYLYVAVFGRVAYPLAIGDKNTQKADLARLREVAANLERNGIK